MLISYDRGGVLVQLAEQLFPTSMDSGSNLAVSKFSKGHLFAFTYLQKKTKRKIGREWPILKNVWDEVRIHLEIVCKNLACIIELVN